MDIEGMYEWGCVDIEGCMDGVEWVFVFQSCRLLHVTGLANDNGLRVD